MHNVDKQVLLDVEIKAACGNNPDWIAGVALGSKPKYFVVGDEPNFKDYVTRRPFSGIYGEILTNLFSTLNQKFGAEPEDCYITYLVKTNYTNPGDLTADLIKNEWLQILRMEYEISGCTDVVCIGKMVKQYSGYISGKSTILKPYKASFMEKMGKAWQVLRS